MCGIFGDLERMVGKPSFTGLRKGCPSHVSDWRYGTESLIPLQECEHSKREALHGITAVPLLIIKAPEPWVSS